MEDLKTKNPSVQGKEVETSVGFFDEVVIPPDWLTQNYVQTVLQKYENDPKLKITNYAVTSCTQPGDNFVGVIFRAAITYNTNSVVKSDSFIYKIEAFLDGAKKDFGAGGTFFATEGKMYLEVLPAMQELLKNIGDPEILAPELVHYCAEPKILIFKDLCKEGFDMARDPVPFEQTSQIAKKIAKFHALSYFLKEEQGDKKIETFTEGMFTESQSSEWQYIDNYFAVLCDLLCEWNPDFNTIADKLTAIKGLVNKKMVELFKPHPKGQGINVLNHGDFHIKNLMFHFDATNKKSFMGIRLIDFQFSVYGTPAIDLASLLYLVADRECREKHRDRLIKDYHDQFKGTLTSLGYLGAVPSLLDFQIELLKGGPIELVTAVVMLSFFHFNMETMTEFDFMDPENMPKAARATFEEPEFKSALMKIMPELMYKGVLEV